jgi:hypothetical protein
MENMDGVSRRHPDPAEQKGKSYEFFRATKAYRSGCLSEQAQSS